jgi:recombination protein RecA
MNKEEKLQLIQKAAQEINKDYGKGSLITLGDKPKFDEQIIPTGSLSLDIATGVGGFPKGRIVEIYGDYSSGKTTLATHVIAESQKLGGIAAYLDVENSFDKAYAEALGVNTDELYFTQPSSAEEALQIAGKIINSGGIDVIVIDSVAALVPQGELDGEMGESKMGLQARIMGQFFRKNVHNIAKNNVLVIFINQTREKIGVIYGSPLTTSGGKALGFYSSIRIHITRNLADKESGYSKTTAKLIKNKVAPPFKEAQFNILFGYGIDRVGEVVDKAIEFNIITKSGSWFVIEDVKIQGRDALRQLLLDNDELYKKIESQVVNRIKNGE